MAERVGDKRSAGAHFTPRLSIDISTTQRDDLNGLIPHGLKTKVFQALVDGVIHALSNLNTDERNAFLGAVLKKREGATSYDIVVGNTKTK